MYVISGSAYIPAFDDSVNVDFCSFDTREKAEAWIEENDWTGISFYIWERD